MDTEHANALAAFEDEITGACWKASLRTRLTYKELAEELRRIAESLEAEA